MVKVTLTKESLDRVYLPNLTNIRECGYFCRYFCKYKKQLLYFLMTEGFQTFYSITILRTDISGSRTKPEFLLFLKNLNSAPKIDFTVKFMYILVSQSCNKIALFGT